MAFFFSGLNKVSTSGTVQSVDSSIVGKLQESGYNLNQASITLDQLLKTTQPTKVQLLPGAFVPVYQSSGGTMYIVTDKSQVLIVSKAPSQDVVPPQNFGGGVPFVPPNISEPQTPITPIIPSPGVPPIGQPPILVPTPTPPPPLGGLLGSGKVFTQFQLGDVVANQQSTITKALWSNNVGNLLTFFTSSNQTATQKRYYYEIFNSASSAGNCVAAPQFSIAYGHKLGSGSADEGGQVNDTPSRAIYGQYRLLCLEPGQERFVINGTATDHIYAINVNRARFREKLDEGNIEINIHHLSGSEFVAGGGFHDAHTGSNVQLAGTNQALRLIDDSKTNPATITTAGEVYNIVSGSIEDGIYNPSNPQKFGLLYPRLGIAILDARALDNSASFATVTGSEVPGDNSYKLFTAMSGAAANLTDASGDILGFAGRSSEKVKSTHFFVRIKNSEYNFSNNPTFTTGSEGNLAEPTFIGNPQVYVTTVGLYNPRKELMAVAKLSKPLLKNFEEEATIKIRLDF